MSVVFSPPSWGRHSASLLINSPQAATDPTLHWPINMQLASDWIINRMCYPQNSHRWAQSLRSNLRGSELPLMSTVPEIKPQRIRTPTDEHRPWDQTSEDQAHLKQRGHRFTTEQGEFIWRAQMNRCGYCRIKVELQLKYCTWCQFDTL